MKSSSALEAEAEDDDDDWLALKLLTMISQSKDRRVEKGVFMIDKRATLHLNMFKRAYEVAQFAAKMMLII